MPIRGIALDALADRLGPVGSLTRAFNFLSLPALSMPVAAGADGMPVGLQVVGRPFAEVAVLNLAAAYQGLTEWHLRQPPA